MTHADYLFSAWSGGDFACGTEKLYETSGDIFDDYCFDVTGQGWHFIGGSASSIDGESLQFFYDSQCTNTIIEFDVDDTTSCKWFNDYAASETPEIGSWRPHKE